MHAPQHLAWAQLNDGEINSLTHLQIQKFIVSHSLHRMTAVPWMPVGVTCSSSFPVGMDFKLFRLHSYSWLHQLKAVWFVCVCEICVSVYVYDLCVCGCVCVWPCCVAFFVSRGLSSPTRDWTWALEVKAQNPEHWTSRNSSHIKILKSHLQSPFLPIK